MLELSHCSGDPGDPSHLAAFIKLIRFCFVDGPLEIDRMCMNIDREFLKSLKSIKDDFLVTGWYCTIYDQWRKGSIINLLP